jgi:cytochrome c553
MNRSTGYAWIAAACLLSSTVQAQPLQGGPATGGNQNAKATLCDTCHTLRGADGKPVLGEMAGGKIVVPGVASSNLTPSASGLGKFNETMFRQAIREGQVGDRKLKVMNPVLFRNLSDDDLHEIWTYLQKLPKVNHIVDNTKPPTLCKKCGQNHGGGDMN